MSTARLTTLSALLLAVRAAAAQEAAVQAEAEPEQTTKPRLEIDGRIYVRETVADDGVDGEWGAQTSIASARVGLRYHRKQLRARVQAELRKSAKLRKAYLEVEPVETLSVRAGLFKMPLSPMEITSSWTLPVADRGLVSTILRDRLQVAGRRIGAQVAWTPEAGASWPFTARAGYYQGLNDLGDLLDEAAADAFGKVVAGRVELGPFGVTGQVRQGRPDVLGPTRGAWAASADATVAPGGLRLWLEVTLGSSWLVADATREDALFVETRGLVSWRLGGAKGGAAYVEPYVMLGLVDPDGKIADDLVVETTAGVNLGQWKRWRLQVELEVWRFGDNVPTGFVDPGAVPVARTAVVTQLGASFR